MKEEEGGAGGGKKNEFGKEDIQSPCGKAFASIIRANAIRYSPKLVPVVM